MRELQNYTKQPRHSRFKPFLYRNIPYGVYYEHECDFKRSCRAEPVTHCRVVARRSSSGRRYSDRLHLQQPQVSKHLRVLHDAGLVGIQPAANRRIYKLETRPLQELDAWLGSFRRVWEDRFDQLEDYLQELQSKAKKPDGD